MLRVAKFRKFEKTAFHEEAILEAIEREKENGPVVASYGKRPSDNIRVLMTIRPLEQGPARTEFVYWTDGERFGTGGW